MIQTLRHVIRNVLPPLLNEPNYPWETLDVTYEDPHVERVWCQLGDYRINLHRIHPCDKPLYHPHTVPSATWIAEVAENGCYRMGVGHVAKDGTRSTARYFGTASELTVVELGADAYYEMLDPDGWHWVQPVGGPVMSVFLTGKPWKLPPNFPRFGKEATHGKLSVDARLEILNFFRRKLTVTHF